MCVNIEKTVSEIWHGQKEKPAYNKYILVLSVDNGLNNGLATYYLDHWYGIKAWCYLDDILKTIPDNLKRFSKKI